ncbi:hypothetical protein LCGC14_0912520 [marine sediment metagenome]|uniref:Uncharacterized protein n=1 Tax=marine sediment metagenome TaxID=412755 RepID=A0A0F9RZX9_9ZZZZ
MAHDEEMDFFDADDVFFKFKDKKDSTDLKKIRKNSGLEDL